MPAGQGVPKRPSGSLCSDCTGKNFPWWLAVKSRVWLLMSSRVTHVINGTASWSLLECCKFLSFLSLPPSHAPSFPLSPPLSHHLPSLLPSLSLFHTLPLSEVVVDRYREDGFSQDLLRWRGSSSCDRHIHELGVILQEYLKMIQHQHEVL